MRNRVEENNSNSRRKARTSRTNRRTQPRTNCRTQPRTQPRANHRTQPRTNRTPSISYRFNLPINSQYVFFKQLGDCIANLWKKFIIVYSQIMAFIPSTTPNTALPTKNEILQNHMYYQILIGTQADINTYSVFRNFNGSVAGRMPHHLIQAGVQNINENYSFFMRHSIRLDEFFKGNIRYNPYRDLDVDANDINISKIPNLPEIYSMFYPLNNQWLTEPVLTKLGMFLAYTEGIRMYEAGVRFDTIFSSPYIRCIQTAIMVALAMGNTHIYIKAELGEKMDRYNDMLNFYKKYPHDESILIYQGIRIISDGKKRSVRSENDFSVFRQQEPNRNTLFIGHDTTGVGVPNAGSYAYVVGFRKTTNIPIYASRSLER